MSNKCRFCGKELKYDFVDLGLSPLADEFLSAENSLKGQMFYPLKVKVCDNCFLVQAGEYSSPEKLFHDYKYMSSNSAMWLKHASDYADMIVERLSLKSDSTVVEIASNDGYLLQYFNKKGIRNYGVEPADNCAEIARSKGIDVVTAFFGDKTAAELANTKGKADLIIGNNVLAHVPDINSFVEGMNILLKDNGTITMEFPHLLNLMKQCQFDTIYQEHFSYISLYAIKQVFEAHGLKIYDVEQIPTHGGSLRIYAEHSDGIIPISENVGNLLNEEIEYGINKIDTYLDFQKRVRKIKYKTLELLCKLAEENKKVIGYGAAAKGNTFLNYCGIGREFLPYIVDVTPEKQGLFTPGRLIEVVGEEVISKIKPDYIAILPWNWKEEITKRLEFTREWGCKLITFIPEVRIF